MTKHNPLDPYAYRDEAMPHTIHTMVVAEDKKVGVHTTTEPAVATIYAVNKASVTEDSIGIVLVLDVSGLEAHPDLDAEVSNTKHGWIIDGILEDPEVEEAMDAQDLEALQEAVDQYFEYFEIDTDRITDTWKSGAYQWFDEFQQRNIGTVLFNLEPEELIHALEEHKATGSMPVWIWALIVSQSRFLEPIGLDRVVEIMAVHPIQLELAEYGEEVESGLEAFSEEDFAEESWLPSMKTVWKSGRRVDDVQYHGTDLVRLRKSFPELDIDNPFEVFQPEEDSY